MATNVCQFFLQGKCKFGQRCRNLHPGAQNNVFSSLTGRPTTLGPSLNSSYNQPRQQQQHVKPGGLQYNRFSFLKDDDGGNTWTSSRSDNSLFDRTNRSSTSGSVGGLNPFLNQTQEVAMGDDDVIDVENIKATLCADVLDWNNSALWPLTSYSPITGLSLFPEFTDVSTEEMRWEYYTARHSNNLQEYTNKVNQLVLSRKMLVSQLVTSGSDDVVNRLSMVKDKLLTTKNPVVFTSLPPSTLPSSDKSSTTSTVTVTLSPAKQPTTTTTAPKSSPQVTSTSSLSTKSLPSSSSRSSLTSEDIAAFKADNFTLHKIPTHAPPPELC